MADFKHTKTVYLGIFILILMVAISAVKYYNRAEMILSAKIVPVEYYLPDNSSVVIEVDSKLEYKRTFPEDRTVRMRGNVKFNIRDLSTKMIILVEELSIEANNTTLSVETIDNQIKIEVLKGNSITINIQDKVVSLEEHQHFIYNIN